jgi:DNA-binding NtrC family response regulator
MRALPPERGALAQARSSAHVSAPPNPQHRRPASTGPGLAARAPVPARVLIVDDEPRIGDLLRQHLIIQGYLVETTTTGAAAVAAIRRRSPDVVLLDLNMPGTLDGRAVLRAIGGHVPVIVVTGINDAEDARATLQAGAFDFISKPFDLNRVSELVAAAVAYRGAL